MCGIFAILNSSKSLKELSNEEYEKVKVAFEKGSGRGPEFSTLEPINDAHLFGFHRLAINGFNNPTSVQPIKIKNYSLICNGEIYNWKDLHSKMNIKNITGSDCEIIIHLYDLFGPEYMLNVLDGVFAFVLYDHEKNQICIARDCFGVRPLFISKNKSQAHNNITVASEIKMMIDIVDPKTIQSFLPATYMMIDNKNHTINSYRYFKIGQTINVVNSSEEVALSNIRVNLINAVKKRVENTDRTIACLLSGGLDSSIITSIVTHFHGAENLHTWSIGMKGSEDLKFARKVADFLGTQHHSIELGVNEFIDAIEEVIKTIESYDTTTVRASVGNWLIAKYIRQQSEAKVVFNGDGSDEVTGGYMYFHYANNPLEFDHECKRLLNDIHIFDVLRSDRSISSHGLEARTPFLDKNFIESYLSIPAELRFNSMKKTGIEKYLLRKAFDTDEFLPTEVLWRTKEAFSDGVSHERASWFEMIQQYAISYFKVHAVEDIDLTDGKQAEKYLYKQIFNKYYPDTEQVIPYLWMPKFVDATDASARTLSIYNKNKTQNDLLIVKEN